MDVQIGQLACRVFREVDSNAKWYYMVVKRVFKDRIEFEILDDGESFMQVFSSNEILNDQPTKSEVSYLYDTDNNPVILKKGFFSRKYKF